MSPKPIATYQHFSWTHLALSAFIVLWLDVGVAGSLMETIPTSLKFAVVGGWLILATTRSRTFLQDAIGTAWPLLLFIIIVVLHSDEIAKANQYSQNLTYLLIAFLLYSFYSADWFRRERHVVLATVGLDFLITGVRTVIRLQNDPLLARYLATTAENRTAVYGSQSFAGLGGYGLAYALAAVAVVALAALVRSERKLLLLLIAGGCALAVIEMSFATAIVMMILLGGAYLIHDSVRRPDLRIVLGIILVIGFLAELPSRLLRAAASANLFSDAVATRLSELDSLLTGSSLSGSDLLTRFSFWSQSIETFLDSGPFGLAGTGRPHQEVGNHAEWLDLLAAYGVWSLLLLLFFAFARRRANRTVPSDARPALGRAWLFFALLGFVNTLLFSTIVLTWMFVVPALCTYLPSPSKKAHASEPEVIRA